jgi:histidine triad (HIT) family protein
MPKPCPFCAIVRGEAAAEVVYEDEGALAFLDRSPLAKGHLLLVPRAHVETLFEADDATVTALAFAGRTLAIALKLAFEADGVFVAQNNVVSQSVPHLHTHLVPRRFGDKLFSGGSMVWRRVRYKDDAERAEAAEKVRRALSVSP